MLKFYREELYLDEPVEESIDQAETCLEKIKSDGTSLKGCWKWNMWMFNIDPNIHKTMFQAARQGLSVIPHSCTEEQQLKL